MSAPRVLVVGGGVAGLEGALALLAHAGELVSLTMVADQRHLVYRPLAVSVPFGGASVVKADLATIAADRGFRLIAGRAAGVDLERRTLTLTDGRVLSYDHLILAVGAQPRGALPGALTFRGPQDVERLRAALGDLEARDGGRVAFVARSTTDWTLPMYELALLTATWGARRELDLPVMVVTPERSPLEVLGTEASLEALALLRAARVELYLRTVAEFTVDGGLWVPIEGRIDADLVVALPVLVGPAVAGLPRDELGFVPVDEHCRIAGAPGAYAVGDMTAHPIKQGGLAAQQADVAAATIAAAVGARVRPEPYRPVIRALMLTGGRPRYFRDPACPGHAGPTEDPEALPWWPPHKIVAAHLAPYLATHADLLLPLDG